MVVGVSCSRYVDNERYLHLAHYSWSPVHFLQALVYTSPDHFKFRGRRHFSDRQKFIILLAYKFVSRVILQST